nr:hypothetical protein [uncultured Desulfobulbus sp.]
MLIKIIPPTVILSYGKILQMNVFSCKNYLARNIFTKILPFTLALVPTLTYSSPLNLQKNAEGWTIFSPSIDSRIVYISSTSGDDSTCTYHLPGTVGADVFYPSSATPCATYKKALTFAREGYPDWILFKRGETFTIDISGAQSGLYAVVPTSGRGAAEPSFTGAYGGNGASPIVQIDAGVGQAIRIQRGSPNWIAVANLDFYSFTRDPSNSGYVSPTGNQLGMFIFDGNSTTTHYNGLLIEGCKFRYFDDNMVTSTTVAIPDLAIRRNLFLDSYAGGGQSHNQGLLLTKQNATLEENIFIHNGWLVPAGGGTGEATIFNHNVYTSSPFGATYTNNIFIQGSNMNTKFTADAYDYLAHSNTSPILIDGNLYIDGQQGIGFGNNTVGNTYPFKNVSISNNVFTNIGRQNNLQGISWGIDMGYDTTTAEISNNLFLNQADPTVNNGNFIFCMAGILTDISVHDNISYNVLNTTWMRGFAKGSQNSTGSTKTNVNFYNNKHSTTSAGYFVDTNSVSGYSFTANSYYGDKSSLALFRVASTQYSLSDWQSLSKDTSTVAPPSFPEPTRSIETYMTSLGENGSIDAFITKCRAQDRYNWDPRFTAQNVNQWIRGGFAEIAPPIDFKLSN